MSQPNLTGAIHKKCQRGAEHSEGDDLEPDSWGNGRSKGLTLWIRMFRWAVFKMLSIHHSGGRGRGEGSISL